MRKEWMAPVAVVEQFVPNEYIAVCVTYDLKCNAIVGQPDANGNYGIVTSPSSNANNELVQQQACGYILRIPINSQQKVGNDYHIVGPYYILNSNYEQISYDCRVKGFMEAVFTPSDSTVEAQTGFYSHIIGMGGHDKHFTRAPGGLESIKVTSTFS